MKFIAKGAEPRALIQWKADNAQTPENRYYGGGGFPAEAVREALLAEQFHLCAYTMKRLKTTAECRASGHDTRAACHIEHILPQARKIVGEDIDYQNLVACYPPSQAKAKVACDYGAIRKGDFDPATGLFVSPLAEQAERHFAYDSQGRITGVTSAGLATLEILNLNHSALVNDRAAVIKGALTPRRAKPLSAAAARRLADQAMIPDAQGCLPAYCNALAAAARVYAERTERRTARLRARGAR